MSMNQSQSQQQYRRGKQMPELLTDSEDAEWDNYQSDTSGDLNNSKEDDSKEDPIIIANISNENSFKFQSKKRINVKATRLKELPDNLDVRFTAGAISDREKYYTNAEIENNTINDGNGIFNDQTTVIIIQGNQDPTIPCILWTNAIYSIENDSCILLAQEENYDEDEIEDVYFNKTRIIRSRNAQWYIHVPIRHENGETIKTWIFADPGANTPCVKTEWAIKNFPNMIARNKILRLMLTPGGPIKPKYSLWMTFPAKENTVLKVKMNLVNDLPVDILADINMLEAFGYTFRDETPPVFQHREKPEIDLDLKEDDEFVSNRTEANWFNCITRMKIKETRNMALQGDDTGKICLVDRVYDGNNIIFDSGVEKRNLEKEMIKDETFNEHKVHGLIPSAEVKLVEKKNENEMLNVNLVKEEELTNVDSGKLNIYNVRDNLNEDRQVKKKGCPIYHKCMMLNVKNSFLAGKGEIAQAKRICDNKILKFPNFDYLKSYERKYGKRFRDLYRCVMEWLNNNRDIFATHTYSRRTMFTEHARLGIKPEHRDKIMYCPQYPISAEKRIHMINYTLINEKNGFWYKIPRSQHGIPYLMVPKKSASGVILRYRPAFDARIVNQYCKLMQCMMPTFQDFRNLHQKRGLTTLADIKNFFDCIPLHWKDRKYAVCFTPIGIYCMTCLTYGFMNAAPEAQKRTNLLAFDVGNTLAYIDDIQIKHPMDEGTQGVIESLNRLSDHCRKYNIQLNPKKFYPATDESEAFGFKNTLIGQMVSDSYKRKILATAKPTTRKEMRSFDGLINYINNHVYHNKRIMYWLNRLKEVVDPETKHKRLKWDKESNLAWEQLQYLINHLPLLHHPTKDGQFCLIVDACNYGVGASLYQEQEDPDTGQFNWVLVDLWSKVMPTQLRHCHSMVHEAYALVSACEHWQFHLIRNQFLLTTDNMAVANIFGKDWKVLSPTTQKQLIRLRSKINSFNFSTHHLPGIKNDLADGLSRFTVELIAKEAMKPMDQQQIRLEITALNSDDTMTPLLTEEEKRDFELILQENQILTAKYGNLKRSKVKIEKKINLISDTYSFGAEAVNIYQNKKEGNLARDKRKYQIYGNRIDSGFNSMMEEYRNNGEYLERERLNEYLRRNQNRIIRKGDDQMGEKEMDQLKSSMSKIMVCMNNMIDENVEKLEERVFDEHWKHLTELSEVRNSLENGQANLIDEEYNPRDDPQVTPKQLQQKRKKRPTVITRSRAKREREKEITREDDDDSIEDERKFSKINIRFENVREQMETHEDMMLELFGTRRDLDVRNLEKYREYQESDNLTAIAMRLHKQPNRAKWSRHDMDTLEDQEPGLYDALYHHRLQIKNLILRYKDIDEVTGETRLRIYVPFFIRGKLLDYVHHNLNHHHYSYRYTLRKVARKFWWPAIKSDVRFHCKQCESCQFVKGGPRKRAPLVNRYRPMPRDHVYADILGSIYQRFYILVLVDYATGFSMLIPMEGCDAMSIAHAIIDYWIRIFGYFKFLETDWGSGFTNRLMRYIEKLLDYEHQIAEPRNHRSIGKVERVIGFLQGVINHYNQLLGKELTEFEDKEAAWIKIKVLLPFIQFAFNQRVMRITGISPNMAMFGTNLNDLTDFGRMEKVIDECENDEDLSNKDYQLLRQVKDQIIKMNKMANTNWQEVTKLSVKTYNNKYNITPNKINRNRKEFKVGDEVLYFIGDKQTARQKWREKWSGPWTIDKTLNDSTLILGDPTTGNQKRVSLDRVKKYVSRHYVDYQKMIKYDDEYLEYQRELFETLRNYKVRTSDEHIELDYTTFNNSGNQNLEDSSDDRELGQQSDHNKNNIKINK